MKQFPPEYAVNLPLLEEMHTLYLKNPELVELSWRTFFQGLELGKSLQTGAPSKEMQIAKLIDAYRHYGHKFSASNPIATKKRELPAELTFEGRGVFPTLGLLNEKQAPIEKIIERLQAIYCGANGIEYMHIDRKEVRAFLQERLESPKNFGKQFTLEKKKEILHQLNKATLFEIFLHTKYVGQKRFSLEGGETLIPILHELIEKGSTLGLKECVIGMAHRGRLNVLANVLNKSLSMIFAEFEGYYDPTLTEASGDVKYHKGYSSDIEINEKKIHISLSANPSHLESVDPVVEGKVRAKQVMQNESAKQEIAPVLIHGDASIAGQGVVYECLQMMNLEGYATGGTIHIVVNNQIGFTTLPEDSRSTTYCTDIALGFSAPVFHVNAEDPEECVKMMGVAIELRQKFGCDVFIDMLCYRKYGHNEGDEPFFTQPLEYGEIRAKKTIREHYLEHLLGSGAIDLSVAEKLEEDFKAALHKELEELKLSKEKIADEAFSGLWSAFHKATQEELFAKYKTGVSQDKLLSLAKAFSKIPANFSLHPKLEKLFAERVEAVIEGKIDWGLAEYLAFASLLEEKTAVRLAGQDSRRGTFSHRHAAWTDQKTGELYFPLKYLSKMQGRFDVFNSHLSEFAALGFEFGYSLASPETLVLWEAQYGDFANGAQVVFDQYISGAEQKWARSSGITVLLPHGYEGQGPEHSSARIERYLQLCGENNMQVTNPTTPAQYFHLLRRQVIRRLRKPLIVFTPKGLLRHPRALSTTDALSNNTFEEILDEEILQPEAKRVLLCSGRIYYDLLEEREKRGIKDIALIRIEQLYPLSKERLAQILERYTVAKEFFWVQEEPENMGAWNYLYPILQKVAPKKMDLVARKAAAATAVGSHAMHVKEHQELMTKAFEL